MPAPPASPPQVIRTILSAVGVRCSDDLKKCSCEQASQDSIGQRIPSLRPASGALGQPKPPPSAEKPKPLNAFKVTHAYNWVSASNGSAWA